MAPVPRTGVNAYGSGHIPPAGIIDNGRAVGIGINSCNRGWVPNTGINVCGSRRSPGTGINANDQDRLGNSGGRSFSHLRQSLEQPSLATQDRLISPAIQERTQDLAVRMNRSPRSS